MTPPAGLSSFGPIADLARRTPGLELLLLFGSHARGDTTDRSDWDFGFLATPIMDFADLLVAIQTTVGADGVDLVDLQRASGLLRYRAARDGVLIFESEPGRSDQFRLQAVRFWCDAAPVLQRGYDAVLEDLDA